MYSFARHAARAVPRALSRVQVKPAIRSYTPLCQTSRIQQAWRTTSRSSYAAFSTSTTRYDAAEVDQELSAKLASELSIEKETNDSEDMPSSLRDVLENTQFKVHDVLGEEEVVLTRSFGDEKIRVSFTIADLAQMDPEADYEQDPAMLDEDDSSMQQGGAQTKGATNQGRTRDGNINVAPEDGITPADREELADDESPDNTGEPGFPARVNITIEKPNARGAIQVEATAQDGMIVIDNVYHYAKKELADAKTSEQDWERRNMYTGPPYGNLDQDLQIIFEKYLEERGIDTQLALWIPEYIDYKEQKEYMNWLSEVKGFVDA